MAASPGSTLAAVPLFQNVPETKDGRYSTPPHLAWALGSDWKQTVEDQNGENTRQNAATLWLLQSSDPADPATTTDAVSTTKDLDAEVAAHAATVKVSTKMLTPIAIPRTGGLPPPMFETRVLADEHPRAKAPVQMLIAGRRLSGDKTFLEIRLTCATAAFDKNPEPARKALLGARIATALHP